MVAVGNNIKLVGRNITITTELKNYINKKMENITKYVQKISSLEMAINKQKYIYEIQILLHTYNKKIIKIVEKDKNLWTAIDNVVKRLKDTMVKYKEKIITKKKHSDNVTNYSFVSTEDLVEYAKSVKVVKKMSEKQAAETIKNNKEQTMLFFNTDTNKYAIVNKNGDKIEIIDIDLEKL